MKTLLKGTALVLSIALFFAVVGGYGCEYKRPPKEELPRQIIPTP